MSEKSRRAAEGRTFAFEEVRVEKGKKKVEFLHHKNTLKKTREEQKGVVFATSLACRSRAC